MTIRQTAPKLLLVLLLLVGAAAAQAQSVKATPLTKVWFAIHTGRWEDASRELARAEKAGACKGEVCTVAKALIADGAGNGAQAVELARQAVAAGQDSGLKAEEYNDLGVLLYRRAEGKQEVLELAEKTLRRAGSLYTGGASNIRFNLAKVLEKLGHKDEAQAIMKQLEADGILIYPGMAILGDFQRPGAPSFKPSSPPNRR
ncbi:MAG TPA: hypothetical protein VIA62_20025 [Thermoanaerobaculia bacterium]|jgi:tetratricopeptide (TPR) repeat protein|nr:hypothetical protein [Thermoanaerobaculia bacterium]